jgi:purine-nucleoside phosphorylase
MPNKLEELRSWAADTAIVLGSGLSSVVSFASETIGYTEFPELPRTSVQGHAGQFALSRFGSRSIICAQGRVHLYEGHSAHEVTAGVRLLASAGVKTVILTNAAGSVNRDFAPGEWMMITDHINLTRASPLLGLPHFLDQGEVYSRRLRDRFAGAARQINMSLRQGVYASLLGPEYETPAEVRMLQKLGADAVGMSTVLEAIQARALGLETGAFSCLTNFGSGLSPQTLSHDEVLAIGQKAGSDFARLLQAAFA